MTTTTYEFVDNLRKDLMSLQKQKTLLQSYLDLGGDDHFLSINDDNYGEKGKEVIRLYDDCIALLEHTLNNAEEGYQINKTFLADKLELYEITEYLASIVMPNVFAQHE